MTRVQISLYKEFTVNNHLRSICVNIPKTRTISLLIWYILCEKITFFHSFERIGGGNREMTIRTKKTVYQAALDQGVSRRDFLKMCTALAATMGLGFTQTNQVVEAMETKERIPVIWLQLQDCTGCSESFIRSTHPKIESVLLEMISLEYSEVLSAASGHQVEEAMKKVLKDYNGKYVLAVEGSIPEDSAFLTVGGMDTKETFIEAAKGAQVVIAYGSCSSWGGIPAAGPDRKSTRLNSSHH